MTGAGRAICRDRWFSANHSSTPKDWMVGLRWDVTPSFMLRAEYQWNDEYLDLPRRENLCHPRRCGTGRCFSIVGVLPILKNGSQMMDANRKVQKESPVHQSKMEGWPDRQPGPFCRQLADYPGAYRQSEQPVQ